MSVWIKRGEDEQSLKDCRGMFTYSKLKQNLSKLSPGLGRKVSDLYEHTLDYGAHPNVQGYFTTCDMRITYNIFRSFES